MAQKRRTTSTGAAATAVAPSGVPDEPVLNWMAQLANGQSIAFQMTNSDLLDALDRIWFQLESGTILVVSSIVLIGVQGKA